VEWAPAAAGEAAGRFGQQDRVGPAHRESRVIAYLDASALVKRYSWSHAHKKRSRSRRMRDGRDLDRQSSRGRRGACQGRSHGSRHGERCAKGPTLVRTEIGQTSCVCRSRRRWSTGPGRSPGSRAPGYDAVQLASALTWQESVGMEITLATFDTQLWTATRQVGYEGLAGGSPGSRSDPRQYWRAGR